MSALAQPYVQNAYGVAAIVALTAGCVGYFVVLRGAAFATHALAQIGFAGAAGAVLLGLDPLLGLVAFSVAGALGIGTLERNVRERDVVTALILVAALGTGALFLVLDNSFANESIALLFGTIVGVSRTQLVETGVFSLVTLGGLAVVSRPLLFATVSPEVAAARRVPVRALSLAFLVLLALATALTVPVVGTLLIFALTVGPAGAAIRMTTHPRATFALGIVLALIAALGGVALAFATGLPLGFFIATIVAVEYAAARALAARR